MKKLNSFTVIFAIPIILLITFILFNFIFFAKDGYFYLYEGINIKEVTELEKIVHKEELFININNKLYVAEVPSDEVNSQINVYLIISLIIVSISSLVVFVVFRRYIDLNT